MLEKHLFIMMELKYLTERDSRIVLWRNTIQLFHEYKRPKFIGPFKAAEFNYRIESLFTDSTNGKPLKPDIVASSKSGWFVLELTESPNSKKPKLESYDAIDPRDLSQYGLITHSKKPDIIMGGVLNNVAYSKNCHNGSFEIMRCLSKKAPCGSMSCWFIYTPHHLYSIWYIKVTIRGTLPNNE